MKIKVGDTIKIDMKKLTNMKNSAVEQYFISNMKKKLNQSKQQTLYVSGISRDGKNINIRSWSNDKNGDLTIPASVVTDVIIQGRSISVPKTRLYQFVTKHPPKDIKPGDYVQLQGRDIMGMIDGSQILKAMKRTMNVMYVQAVQNNTITVSPYKFLKNASQKFTLPLKFVRWKLEHVQED